MTRLMEGPFGALFLKELRQVRHDRRLIMSLIVPPLLQILLFGLALDSEVRNLRVGVVDYSRTSASRDVLSSLTENRSFILTGYYADSTLVQKALDRNHLDVGVIIDKDFAKSRARGDQARVQVLLNAVNANVATIAQGYIASSIAAWNQQQSGSIPKQPPVAARVALLFNPGLISAWFMVTGTMAILIILNGSIVASTALIKEKESGTVEQLLMTPATSQEVVLAKIAPIFLLLMGMVAIVFVFARVVFQIPVRGNGFLLTAAFALCALAGIGIGTMLATLSRSAQQTQLLTLFINPPLAVLSGSLTPIEAMPAWLQPITLLNPVRHFVTVARGILLKGAGLEVLWPNLLFLIVFTAVLLGISMWQFRKQLH